MKTQDRVPLYATMLVVLHAAAVGLHGVSHAQLEIPLSPLNYLIVALNVLAVALLWKGWRRAGAGLFLGVMAISLLVAGGNHFVHEGGPDFVGGVPDAPGKTLFTITAALRSLLELGATLYAGRALARARSSQNLLRS